MRAWLVALLLLPSLVMADSVRSIVTDNIYPSAGNTHGGVAINASQNVASALFDLESTTKGFLPPQMTTTQKNAISSPQEGLIVFDTTLAALAVYNGAAWVSAGGSGGISYAPDTGAANAYAIAPSPAALSYAAGNAYAFFSANANTGASTINVSSLGTKAIRIPGQGALTAGDILANQLVTVAYDGTYFQMISPQGPATAANTASTLMKRDASGQVAATTFTGAFAGNATSATSATTAPVTGAAANQSYYPVVVPSPQPSVSPSPIGLDVLNGVTINPSTSTVTATNFAGNASTATAPAALPSPCPAGQFMTGNLSTAWNAICSTPSPTPLSNIPNNSMLGNTSGSSAVPSPVPLAAFPTASPTPSAVLALDQNSNALANEIIHGSAVIATSGTQDTLTVASAPIRIYTGSTAQTVQLPTTSTLKVGWQYLLESDTTGSGAISVVNASASAICTLPVVTGYNFNALLTFQTGTTWECTLMFGGNSSTPTTPVAYGGTGINSGTSGGVLYYSGTGTLASSGLLTQYAVVIGGGAGAAPVVAATSSTVGMPFVSAGATSNPNFAALPLGTAGVVSGQLPYAYGGTNANSQAAAQANMSPMTTKGDSTLGGASGAPTRVAVPGDNGRLVPDSAQTTGWGPRAYNQFQNGRPGKNYIQYADFENDATTGWALGTTGTLTNGLPTGSPNFSSGADGNLSIAAASSLLGGSYDLSLSEASGHDLVAGNALWSSSYAIDPEDEAKVLTVHFYFTMSSGASQANFSGTSSNTYAWAPYDVTNSVWLSAAGNFCMTQSSGQGYCTGTFQTGSATANIRFALYVATATTVNSVATTLHVDDFYVGPQTAPMGPAMTDWVAYTPTFTGFGTATSVNVQSKRVGDSLLVRGCFTPGTNTATQAAMTLGYNGANSNVTTSSAMATNQHVGSFAYNASNVNSFTAPTMLTSASVGYLNFGAQGGSNGGLTPENGNAFPNTTTICFYTSPIAVVGWSSNTAMSSDAITRQISARVSSTGTQTISSVSFTKLTIIGGASAQVTYDNGGGWSTSGNSYTIGQTGYWDFALTGTIAADNTHSKYVSIDTGSAGNSGVGAFTQAPSAATQYPSYVVSQFLTAGTVVSVSAAVDSGGSLAFSAFGLSINLHSGPAVISATETVSARYYSSSTSLSGSLATINFATKDYDDHAMCSAGVCTPAISGKYAICAGLSTGGTVALNSVLDIQIQIAGSVKSEQKLYAGGAMTDLNGGLCDTLYVLSGQTIQVQASSSATLPTITSSNSQNYMTVVRVGN